MNLILKVAECLYNTIQYAERLETKYVPKQSLL